MKKKKNKIKTTLETWKPKKANLGIKEMKDIVSVFVFIGILVGGIRLVHIINKYQYWKNIEDLYKATVTETVVDYSFLKPFRNWNVPDMKELNARSVAILSNNKNQSRFIFEKNADQIVPIASITKLVSAYIVLTNYELDTVITISEEASRAPGVRGFFSAGEKILVKDLLYSALIESSNDSIKALADDMGESVFVEKMNQVAKNIGLERTFFIESAGLDPNIEAGRNTHNYSTAKELALLTQYLINRAAEDEKIAKIFEITRMDEQKIYFADGRFHHNAQTTNRIIEEYSEFIIAKTGQTPLAGQCFLVAMPHPKNAQAYIVYVILGSNNRFGEAKELIDWSYKAFVW